MSDHFRIIGRIARAYARLADAQLRPLGLATAQLPVLVTLKSGAALAQSDLAREAQVEQPSMAQLLARMERDGLVARTPHPDDRRSQHVSLTPAARRLLPRAKALLDAQAAQALSTLSAAEVAQLLSLLQRVGSAMDALVAAGERD